MNRSLRNLRLLLRAETLLAEYRLSLAARKAGLLITAALIAGAGAVMLNIAAFFALTPEIGPAYAALAVACANFLIALILALIARSTREGREVTPIKEVRDLAMTDLEESADSVRADIATIRGLTTRPGETLATTLIGPIFVAILRGLLGRGKRE